MEALRAKAMITAWTRYPQASSTWTAVLWAPITNSAAFYRKEASFFTGNWKSNFAALWSRPIAESLDSQAILKSYAILTFCRILLKYAKHSTAILKYSMDAKSCWCYLFSTFPALLKYLETNFVLSAKEIIIADLHYAKEMTKNWT